MTRIKIHILQHEPFEGAGLIEDWAKENGHQTRVTLVYDNEPLPALNSFDWLVIMGGGMSVNDEDTYDWLKPEKAFVKEAIDAGKTLIGICFGSQMLANVLGKKVFKNSVKEIGWWPVQLTGAGKHLSYFTGAWNNQIFFHWHGETFDMPDKAIHVATSAGCTNQAFDIDGRIFGFQFHPETNLQTLAQMVSSGSRELVKNKFVMGVEEILADKGFISKTQPLFFEFLDKLSGRRKD